MAEFCFDCWKKLFDENAQKEKYIISKYDDLCEGCGEYKPVVIIEKKYYYLRILKRLFFPVIFIFVIISIPFRLIYYPLLRYKLKKVFAAANTHINFEFRTSHFDFFLCLYK